MIYFLFCVSLLGVVCLAENVIRFHLLEELPVGTMIGNVAIESGIRTNLTDGEFSRLRYSLLDQSKMRSLFTIHESTGNLLIKDIIDRETQCIFLVRCVLSFDVAIHSTNPQIFEIYTIEITIEDRNDNSPKFLSESMTLQIHESTLIGTTFGVDEAIDIDSTLNNTVKKYELVTGQEYFGINATNDLEERFLLKLILLKQLDREDKDTFKLEVLAKDGGDPVRTGTLTINIMVEDDNDNTPVFEQESYAISIKEGTRSQTPLLAVTAHDKDIGNNGEVTYRFNSRQFNIEQISQIFSINDKTGVIYVLNDVIYGKQNIYEISVEASDKGSQPRTSYASVTITILDTVNNKPEVHINFLVPANDSFVSLSETADVGTVIAHVTVGDADSGPNGQVICAITNDYVALQNISGKPGYLIVLKREFDRESKQEHYISVTCSDNGTPKLSTSKSFIIQVLDENDNEPQFTQVTYSTVIDENNERGASVLKVSATDSDVWPNDAIHYVLTENHGNLFSIDSSTGVITANQILDREKQDEYRFTVLAIDNGSPALTGTAVVAIVLRDVNDKMPEFDVPFFQFFIKENLPSDTLIGIVNAHDDDIGINKKIVFSLLQNHSEDVPFSVSSNGEIKATTAFDREEDSSFIFEIVATDQGLPPLSSTIFVRVFIIDENDNKPAITHPNSINSTIIVSYSHVAGTYLTTIKASDADENGQNSLLYFELVTGNEDDILSIGKTSGKIYLKRPYEAKSTNMKTLTVRVSDNGKPSLNTTQTFNLVMKYVESNAVSSLISGTSGNKNVIISIAVVSMTLIISGALIAIICVLRRSEQIRKKFIAEHEKQKYIVPEPLKQFEINLQNKMNLKENISYPESLPDKGKDIHSSYDEDLDNMELYNSFSTSVFTDTLPGLEVGTNVYLCMHTGISLM